MANAHKCFKDAAAEVRYGKIEGQFSYTEEQAPGLIIQLAGATYLANVVGEAIQEAAKIIAKELKP